MSPDTLYRCKKEVERFLRLADKALEENHTTSNYLLISPKTSGALRRSSMDLTRALADLRQNR